MTVSDPDDDLSFQEQGEPEQPRYSSPQEQAALEPPIREVIEDIRTLLSRPDDPYPARTAVNISEMIEAAAEKRDPGDVATLVQEFRDDDGTGYLARNALDAAAARRTVDDIAEIVRIIARDAGPDQAEWLLQALITRRLPQRAAQLLIALGNGDDKLTDYQERLVCRLSTEQTRGDCRVMVVLWLRAHKKDALADLVAGRLAEARLPPGELAVLILGLGQRDAASADVAVLNALKQEPAVLAAMIGFLREEGGGEDARVLERARAELPAEKLIELIREIGDGARTEEWLRQAALDLELEQIVTVAMKVDDDEHSERVFLSAVARKRTVADIFTVARELSGKGRPEIGRSLLNYASQAVHERDGGVEVAEFLHGWLGEEAARRLSSDARHERKKRAADILKGVAERRNPALLMDLIDGLTRYEKSRGGTEYDDYKSRVEDAVKVHFQAEQLIALPGTRRGDHLHAMLDIERAALKNRRAMPAERVPDLVEALQAAGVTDVCRLLSDGCSGRSDRKDIREALRNRNMGEEAHCIGPGHILRFS